MPRPARVLTALAAMALATVLLTACDKPVPGVTFLAGSTTTVVRPATYCFDPGAHCHRTTKLVTINAKSSSTVLVDVPADVANQHWVVTAYSSTNGKTTALDGFGSDLLHNRHTVRLPVPVVSESAFYLLQVVELRQAAQVGTWTVQVHVTE